VLVRHWQTTKPAEERWLKEFSADGLRVRLTKKADDKRERGTWYVCRELRIEAVLDAANAPDESPEDDR
jgi:hypothetical protein